MCCEAGAALHPKPLPSNYLHDTAALSESLRSGWYLMPSGLRGFRFWKLLGCQLSSGEKKSGLTCAILRLLSSPGLLDVESVCFSHCPYFGPWICYCCYLGQNMEVKQKTSILVSSCLKIPYALCPCSKISSSDQGPQVDQLGCASHILTWILGEISPV